MYISFVCAHMKLQASLQLPALASTMAFSMISVYLCALLALSAVNANPMPVDGTLLDAKSFASITERVTPIGYHGCNAKQTAKLKEANEDASILAKGMGNPEDINFISTMVKDYFGPDARDADNEKTIKGS